MPAPKDPIKYQQWKENIINANQGKNAYWYGKHHSIDTINKIKELFFKKGHTPWNKGIRCSEETKNKISETKKNLFKEGKLINPQKGKTFEELYGEERAKDINAKHSRSITGRLLSEGTKTKISEKGKGRIVTEDTRMKIMKGLKGKHNSPETEFKTGQSLEERFGKERAEEMRKKISLANRGHLGWNKGIPLTKEHRLKLRQFSLGKTLEELHGVEKARELKERQSKRLKGKTHIELYGKENARIRREITSKRTKGKTFEQIYGKERAKEIKAKHSKSLKGKTFEEMYGVETAKLKRAERTRYRAKQITPIKDTKIEVKIQMFLKELGYEYFTHQYMKDIKHGYQCDILIPTLNLVIECDGDYWHKYPIGTEIDHIRTKELLEKGFKVLRLWEHSIKAMDIGTFKKYI